MEMVARIVENALATIALSVDETASILGLSPAHVRRYKAEQLGGQKIGQVWYIPKNAVYEEKERRNQEDTPQ